MTTAALIALAGAAIAALVFLSRARSDLARARGDLVAALKRAGEAEARASVADTAVRLARTRYTAALDASDAEIARLRALVVGAKDPAVVGEALDQLFPVRAP